MNDRYDSINGVSADDIVDLQAPSGYRREDGVQELSGYSGAEDTLALSELLHMEDGLDMSFMREILLINVTVAGTQYRGDIEGILRDLRSGSRVTLLREEDNPYDVRAIMVLDEQGRQLGYVPRKSNPVLSALMDAGK